MTYGQQMCECAYCHKVGTVYVRCALGREVDGFVCLGGMLLPSGRLRALCADCTRKAVASFARAAARMPAFETDPTPPKVRA